MNVSAICSNIFSSIPSASKSPAFHFVSVISSHFTLLVIHSFFFRVPTYPASPPDTPLFFSSASAFSLPAIPGDILSPVFSFSLRSDLHPTDIFHTSLPGNSRDRYFLHTVLSISAQSEAPPDQNHHDNKNYDFPLENPAEEVLQVLAVHFRRLLHSPGIFYKNRKYCRIFKR